MRLLCRREPLCLAPLGLSSVPKLEGPSQPLLQSRGGDMGSRTPSRAGDSSSGAGLALGLS